MLVSPKFILPLICLPLVLGAGCGSGEGADESDTSRLAEEPARGHHVLLIVIDTLRADHLSCYGYWRSTSPNIDGLAQRGVKFTRSISPSSWTAPSMVTMMTGQRLAGPYLNVPIDKPTLAELFRAAGYKTGAWVANPLLSHDMGFARGFDKFVDEHTWHSTQPPGQLDGILSWLKSNRQQDTFTWVHFTDPHDPYSPAADLVSDTPGKISSYQDEIIAEAAEARDLVAEIPGQTEFIAHEVGLYDDEIRTVDRKVRRLLVAMQETGTLDNAIIVLTSDHGECLWERPESVHRSDLKQQNRKGPTTIQHLLKQTHGDFVYQELVHVPLIVVAPGLERGRIEETITEALNLPTTILSLAGIEVDGLEQMVGGNMFGQALPAGAYSMTSLDEAFISEDGWKLILPTQKGQEQFGQILQLYNLSDDSGEHVNLASAFPARVTELTARMAERKRDALPVLEPEEIAEQAAKNAKALGGLGYTEGGIMDPAAHKQDKVKDD